MRFESREWVKVILFVHGAQLVKLTALDPQTPYS